MCANMLKSTVYVAYLSNRMWGVHVVYLSNRMWGVHVWMYACVATHITYIYLRDAYIYLVSFPEGGSGDETNTYHMWWSQGVLISYRCRNH